MNFSSTDLKGNVFRNIRESIRPRIRERRGFFYYLFFISFLMFVIALIFKIIFAYFQLTPASLANSLFSNIVELKKDENGYVNIILIGAGGGEHDGPNLTDTMILTSLDLESGKAVMMSVPRDFYVNYSPKYQGSRINEILRDMSLRFENLGIKPDVARQQARLLLMDQITEITGMDIDYFVQIDFAGFEKGVDALGGVDLFVEQTLIDEMYPDNNWGYETFTIKKGQHHLDGKTALKYARSRHSSSDFSRAARQQAVITAIKDKALSGEIVRNPFKIKRILNIVKKHLETNMSFSEIITLASYASKFSSDGIHSFVLNDDWNTTGGFLATPPRVNYGGAFVLIPYMGEDDFSRINVFSDLIYNHRDLLDVNFEVMNATDYNGYAGKVSKRMIRYGFNVVSVGNSQDNLSTTEVHVFTANADIENFLKFWKEIFPGVETKLVDKIGYYEETNVDIEVHIGTNIRF